MITPATVAALQALAEALPDGAAVPVPREWLLELLSGTAAQPAPSARALPPVDVTVGDLASRYGRSKATCRAWVEAGRFPGAYRMHGSREWRVPQSGVEAFEAAERQRGEQGAGTEPQRGGHRRGKAVDLSAWRRSAS